jgi:hypothetical protein
MCKHEERLISFAKFRARDPKESFRGLRNWLKVCRV